MTLLQGFKIYTQNDKVHLLFFAKSKIDMEIEYDLLSKDYDLSIFKIVFAAKNDAQDSSPVLLKFVESGEVNDGTIQGTLTNEGANGIIKLELSTSESAKLSSLSQKSGVYQIRGISNTDNKLLLSGTWEIEEGF